MCPFWMAILSCYIDCYEPMKSTSSIIKVTRAMIFFFVLIKFYFIKGLHVLIDALEVIKNPLFFFWVNKLS